MNVGIPRERFPGERRVAATPDSVKKLLKLGFGVRVESDAGLAAGFDDAAYVAAGATIAPAGDVWTSDVVAKIRPPGDDEVTRLSASQTLISYLYPAFSDALVQQLAARGVTAIAMDQVPRTTRAQKVDALSSMGNLSGYRAIIEAVNVMQRPLRGQSTAAGKIHPAKVLVIGAGVAGLAAIGTARALGAIVRAFDTRPAAREQVTSMGAEFLEVNIEEDGSGTGGYAKEMSPAFIEAEMALFAAQAREVDIIVTTALIPGKRAPTLITADMVRSMKRGSVVVDLAAEQGGNCELTRRDEAAVVDGVTIVGYTDLPSRMSQQASTLYATNVVHLLEEMGGAANFAVDEANDIVRPMTVLKEGALLWPPPPPAAPPPASRPAPKAPIYSIEHGPPTAERMSAFARWGLLVVGLALLGIGLAAPATFLTHFTVFVLACFIGYQVIWSVTPALHTPLMSVTNAISGIIVIGGMLQVRGFSTASLLGIAAIVLATINIAGGFLVTQRMLRMFHR
ncbi:MAG TPA: Re/Si-specific NAD(P)(+) transhydrogenase subunit alpha [Gemmatimonadaceae bacterium]|nr:MAG: NAD(P) transhydrogenase subunit alpha [Gemmatimonadetes bacterium SCN 70-22]HMN07929.1 Re/Si-specific NAD(P)(+) transhydrogenase subunit alpha [Gemmatimonadaceae bacterium]